MGAQYTSFNQAPGWRKLLKWEPGLDATYASPLHASTVGLIRNSNTNRISPQFHCVYDNDFGAVYSAEGEPPAKWEHMLI
jgi:hypothetical protein